MSRLHNPKLKTLVKATLVATSISIISLPAMARKYNHYEGYNQSTYDYAKVVDVSPVVETYQAHQPVEQCWDERVPLRSRYDKRHYRNKSHTGEILGAIIGGAIGNQFGSGRGKKVATAAGAVLGASVASDIKRQQRHQPRGADRGYGQYKVVQRCEVKDHYVDKERVVGYNVAYKYRGNVFHTEMDRHPGKQIKVKVTVNPV